MERWCGGAIWVTKSSSSDSMPHAWSSKSRGFFAELERQEDEGAISLAALSQMPKVVAVVGCEVSVVQVVAAETQCVSLFRRQTGRIDASVRCA